MSERLLVGTRKGLFILRPRMGAWSIDTTAFLGDQVPMLLPDARDGTLYAALNLGHFGGKLHRSDDGGRTWVEAAVPAYPPRPEDADDRCPMRNVPIPWKLELLWSLEAGGADQPGLLWCGTIPGGLFRSPDRGGSWELVRSLWDHPARREWFGGGYDYPGMHSICVDPRNPRHVTVGVSCGGVWRTPDAGETWECRATGMFAEYAPPEHRNNPHIQDPHRVVQCPAAPEHLWAQHHNGVFRTVDGGRLWREVPNVPPSRFGFAVAVHPREPETAWFVPARSDERRIPVDGRVVVTRTRDGGRSFDVLSQGLPQEHAYDLTYRHGLDVDGSGARLAFGTTTGSLFVSEDAGDHWQCVSTHLPPVLCVRFG
ncbi:MAG: exo-alpha-sialidase [Phycisphaerae bacterium]|nr:exo-alpha-sialidase [Phycisphaerae bacterium]MCZ2398718.1 exo-alpha-sialidase [Phycisphaerae bacterium]NUQ49648.1 exo-alpha-sialidase [Phycisphaerae bacterium]